MNEVALTPESVRAVAHAVAELLADTPPPAARLVDAVELAGLLGVTRSWVYDNAERLGAVRIGDGPRGRLRFNVDRALPRGGTASPSSSRSPNRLAAELRRQPLPCCRSRGPPHER